MATTLHCVLRVALAVLIGALLLAGLLPMATHAVSPRPPAIWSAEWALVGPGVTTEGTMGGLRPLAQRPGLAVATGAEAGYYESPLRDMGGEFMALGAIWQARLPDGAELLLEVRRSSDGVAWGPWQIMPAGDSFADTAPSGQGYSELIIGPGRYVQLRATLMRGVATSLPSLEALRLVAIDARAGVTGAEAATGASPSAQAEPTPPAVISRAA